jgi:uncharacterized protein (TIGR03067 family)
MDDRGHERRRETPGLAMTLMQHARASTTVLGLIGKMGRHAEPVVPLLVEQFLAEWKKYEGAIREEAMRDDDNDRPQQSQEVRILSHWRRVLPLKTLGEISVGPEGYAVLRDLKAISPPRREWHQFIDVPALPGLFETVEEAFARYSTPASPESIPALLGDFWFVAGKWKVQVLVPGERPQNIVAEIRKTGFSWDTQSPVVHTIMNATGAPSSSHQFEIDEMKSPKQITFTHKKDLNFPGGYRAEGIYELAGNNLKIELASPGGPRPKEFSRVQDRLPEGQVLLKFDRELPLPIKTGNR